MSGLKHVAQLSTNGRRCIVAYRVVPGEPDNCIVVTTDSLDADQHDTLMKLVESNTGQTAYELADAMARTQLPDGRNMLQAFHVQGKMVKHPTNQVKMIPNNQTSIMLNELNEMIAKQEGVTVADLAVKPKGEQNTAKSAEVETTSEAPAQDTTTVSKSETDAPTGVLSDEDLAAQYRSQADALFKEAKRLREQAEDLVPTKKRTKKSEESA